MTKTRWYKDAVIYQIYPRSFCDSNGDGIGDLQGIISKLDYLKELGINAVWLSPCYKSPNDDNGYDISDYRDIMDEFGTLDDWKKMVAGMHERGIKLVMDLVANHTSDEHFWFKESRKSVDNMYRDYYIWRKGQSDKKPPNNWNSNFMGKAWEYDKATDEYYLHLFSKKQPDLNWDNPRVRQEISDICNYWFELGVDGFRCDVITYISKSDFGDGTKLPLMGLEKYCLGKNYHQYIKELNANSWSKYDSMIVGEALGINTQNAAENISEAKGELDSVFSFEHTNVDKLLMVLPRKFNLKKFKSILNDWQQLPADCQPTLFLENHDQPRSLPRFVGDFKDKRKEAGKMLAVTMQLQRGTPYIYQGEEIGMTNCDFEVDDYKDIMSINAMKSFKNHAPFLLPLVKNVLKKIARDHARTPMQWNASKNAGFSSGKPWMMVNPNYKQINVEESQRDEDSIFNFYKKLIAFRKGNEIVQNGDFKLIYPTSKKLFAYERNLDGDKLIVISNFTNKPVKFILPKELQGLSAKLVLSNYKDEAQLRDMILKEYESLVFSCKAQKK